MENVFDAILSEQKPEGDMEQRKYVLNAYNRIYNAHGLSSKTIAKFLKTTGLKSKNIKMAIEAIN